LGECYDQLLIDVFVAQARIKLEHDIIFSFYVKNKKPPLLKEGRFFVSALALYHKQLVKESSLNIIGTVLI